MFQVHSHLELLLEGGIIHLKVNSSARKIFDLTDQWISPTYSTYGIRMWIKIIFQSEMYACKKSHRRKRERKLNEDIRCCRYRATYYYIAVGIAAALCVSSHNGQDYVWKWLRNEKFNEAPGYRSKINRQSLRRLICSECKSFGCW